MGILAPDTKTHARFWAFIYTVEQGFVLVVSGQPVNDGDVLESPPPLCLFTHGQRTGESAR